MDHQFAGVVVCLWSGWSRFFSVGSDTVFWRSRRRSRENAAVLAAQIALGPVQIATGSPVQLSNCVYTSCSHHAKVVLSGVSARCVSRSLHASALCTLPPAPQVPVRSSPCPAVPASTRRCPCFSRLRLRQVPVHRVPRPHSSDSSDSFDFSVHDFVPVCRSPCAGVSLSVSQSPCTGPIVLAGASV